MRGQSGPCVRRTLKDAAILAHAAASSGSLGMHDAAAKHREELEDKLEAVDASDPLSELKLVWDTILLHRDSPQEEGLDVEEVEELVLAHLVAFPDFLADDLVMNLFRQVQLGQGFLHAEKQHINVATLLEQMKPRLDRHKVTALNIARECCTHLQTHSETLASKLLLRMDLDGDGYIGEDDFLKCLVHALAVEVENLAISAGVQQLLKEEGFADEFHQAVWDLLVAGDHLQA
ncbi:unnamed protein product [Durusdinium trenchii]